MKKSKKRGAQPTTKENVARRSSAAREATGHSRPVASAVRTSPKSQRKGAPEGDAARTRARPSGLSAAAKVLADAGKPMRCAEMAERVLAQGLWKSRGKTPEATIHSAIIREIRVKGAASRFRKVGRGTFAAQAPAR